MMSGSEDTGLAAVEVDHFWEALHDEVMEQATDTESPDPTH